MKKKKENFILLKKDVDNRQKHRKRLRDAIKKLKKDTKSSVNNINYKGTSQQSASAKGTKNVLPTSFMSVYVKDESEKDFTPLHLNSPDTTGLKKAIEATKIYQSNHIGSLFLIKSGHRIKLDDKLVTRFRDGSFFWMKACPMAMKPGDSSSIHNISITMSEEMVSTKQTQTPVSWENPLGKPEDDLTSSGQPTQNFNNHQVSLPNEDIGHEINKDSQNSLEFRNDLTKKLPDPIIGFNFFEGVTSSGQSTQEFANRNNDQESLHDLPATYKDIGPQVNSNRYPDNILEYMEDPYNIVLNPILHHDPPFWNRLSVDIRLVLNNHFVGLFNLLENKKPADSTSSQQVKYPTPSPNPMISYVFNVNVAFFLNISLCSSDPHLM